MQPEQLATRATPSRIGRYEVLTSISTGGMAELFLGFIAGPGGFRKFVALKRILESFRHEEEFVAMFLDEARITAALSHANIAQVFDLGEDGDALFLAMEYIAGQDLRRVFNSAKAAGRRVPIGFSCAVLRDVCLALHYAHTFKSPAGAPLAVIHRDVSPRNVMVTYSGTPKVIDFGIAKAKGRLGLTNAGRMKGSLAYMSPEQIESGPLDGRSDLFAVGAILYEALTGKSPFQAHTDAATMFRVLTGEVEPPHQLNPEVSLPLSDVVLKALQKNPAARFADGREMARAIEVACGAPFNEEQVGGFMAELFADAIDKSRAMLALAGDQDVQRVAAAAGALARGVAKDEPRSSGPPPPEGVDGVHEPRSALDPQVRSAAIDEARGDPELILAIDDSTVLRVLLERLLRGSGYEVATAASGNEALALLAEVRPALIVLDVIMPELSGFEVCKRIRELPHLKTTPIIFLSGACSLEERVNGLSVGGDDFIRKPFEGPDLLARVRVHLNRARSFRSAD